MLESDRIRLDKFTERSITPSYISWLNDYEVNKYMQTGRLLVSEKDVYAPKNDKDLLFMIRYKESDDSAPYIGTASLHRIDWVIRKAEIGYMIGDKSYWKKGIASEVVSLLTNYGFNRLNLNKITAGVVDGNEGSVKVLLKNGYEKYCEEPEDYYLDGKLLNTHKFYKLQTNHNKEIT